MASIPQYQSDYVLCNEFCEFPAPLAGLNNGGTAMWFEEGLPFFDNGAAPDMDVPPEIEITSSFSVTPFPEQFGVSDMAVPALPEFNMGGSRDIAAGSYSFEAGYQPDVCELGEECNGFLPDFRTVYPPEIDKWGGFQVTQVPAMDEPAMKVGKYSVEERKDRILRYLKKRNQRNFNKTIKYACRKTLADKRVRVRGRFARNNELCGGEEITKKNNNPHKEREFYNDDSVKIELDGEGWLQEAMASLMYLPYISG